jgi:hypothetical protein
MLDADGAFAAHVVNLLAYDKASSGRIEELLRDGVVPDDRRETAIQLVESLMQNERDDLRQSLDPAGGAA